MDSTIQKFADYAAGLRYADLTPQAIHAVKRCMVDAMGCALGAFNAEPIKAVRTLASRVSASTPATLIGTQVRTSPEWAAFVNGSMVRYSDFSDDYFGGNGDTGPHPSDNIGGMLAAAEATGADGRNLALGIALAYEACGQLVDHTTLRAGGWDHPVMHCVATALGAGKLFGLTRDQLASAVGLAVVSNIGLFETRIGDISNWKGLAGPNGSRNGLFAALLAKEGISGPPAAFEGRAGFMKQLNTPFKLGAFGGGDIAYKIEGTFFKYMPCRYEMQLPVWVALKTREQVKIEDIESICVYLEKRTVDNKDQHPERWNPHSRETADHSGPYLIGAGLIDGGITAQTFTPERYRDPVILALIQKIRFQEDPAYTAAFPRTLACRFDVGLKSGKTVTVELKNPKGHPTNPMSDQELEEKFMKQVAGALAPQQARSLLAQLWKLDELASVQPLFALMQVASAK